MAQLKNTTRRGDASLHGRHQAAVTLKTGLRGKGEFRAPREGSRTCTQAQSCPGNKCPRGSFLPPSECGCASRWLSLTRSHRTGSPIEPSVDISPAGHRRKGKSGRTPGFLLHSGSGRTVPPSPNHSLW